MHSNDEGMGRKSVDSERACVASHTSGIEAVGALTDEDLLAGTRRLVCQSNRVLAALLARLAEVEARGLHRRRACATLYNYCIYELRMSEDAAYRRVAAARLLKRFPAIFGCVERGELHLTALLLLAPHLTDANVGEVLARAKFRTKKEILKLVRLLSPLPDVPSRIEPLGLERRPAQRATWSNLMAARCPVRELQPDERPGNWLPPANNPDGAAEYTAGDIAVVAGTALARNELTAEDPVELEPQAAARVETTESNLDGPQRFKVQFTASEEYVALVEEAKALLAHALPRADIAEIHLRAMQTLVAELKKRKYATSARPSKSPAAESLEAANSRVDDAPAMDTEPALPAAETSKLERKYATSARRSKSPAAESLEAANSRVDDAPAMDTEPALPAAETSKLERHMDHGVESPRQRDRYIPAAVRRTIFERDGNRCAYVDPRGERCRETSRLEFHHREPFARGGPATPDNLSIYCAAHNALAAEQDFGRELASVKREQEAHFTERYQVAHGAEPPS